MREWAIISSSVEEHVLYQIANAPMREHPYAHIYVEDVFPEDFYAAMRAHWPSSSALVSLADTGRVPKGAYPERFVLPFTQEELTKLDERHRAFWFSFGDWFLSRRFMNTIIGKFERHVHQRFGDEMYENGYSVDALIVRDLTNYSIGPHTDAPHRLLSMLFYCPDDDRRAHLGTSIYVPREPGFRCEGGPHYPHDRFTCVRTMGYRRNTLFAFIKNDYSFHGVGRIDDKDVQRDVLLYDIRVERQTPVSLPVPAPAAAPGLRMLKRLFGGGA